MIQISHRKGKLGEDEYMYLVRIEVLLIDII